MVAPELNLGAARLVELFPNRGDQQTVASAVGTASSVVSRWMRGERKPSAEMRGRLETLYGIGWRLWDQDADDAA